MSISTDVYVEYPLPDDGPVDWFHTFDAGEMFSVLRLDADGRLWEIMCEFGETWILTPDINSKPATPYAWNGVLCFRTDRGREHAAFFTEGQLVAIRPGWREAWEDDVEATVDAPVCRVRIFAALYDPPVSLATRRRGVTTTGWNCRPPDCQAPPLIWPGLFPRPVTSCS